MAIKNEALKKHHFWILAGLVPLLVLIAVIMITSGVGAAIDEKRTAIKKATDDLKTKSNPKPNDLLTKLDDQVKVLGEKRTSLWQQNWERQIGIRPDPQDLTKKQQIVAMNLFPWPNSPVLTRFNYTLAYATNADQLKFGAPIPDTTDLPVSDEFRKREVYYAEFSNPNNPLRPGMVDRVAPTQFNGGWERVLRHVAYPASGPNGWGNFKPTSDQLWLALEDIWVQRAMLESIHAVNEQLATFHPVQRLDEKGNALPDSKLERTFQSRIWRVDLKVVTRPEDNRYVLTGSITNLTDRLQLFGHGNVMVLRVWLTNDPNAPPKEFRIGGEFVPGKGKMAIVTTNDHLLDVGVTPTEIARVEQVFDTRTVPVRRIERLVMGYPDSRNANVPLKSPLFIKEAAPAATSTDPNAPAGSSSSGSGSSAGPPGGTGGKFGTGGPGGIAGAGMGGSGAASGPTAREGGGTVATVLDANKQRYLDVTSQVRRMPVAIVLVIDQSQLQDVLVAYANSPLRFQITQVHWKRFRDSLGGSVGGSSSGNNDDSFGGSAKGSQGSGFEAGGGFQPGGGGSSLGPPGGMGGLMPPGGGSSLGPPGGGAGSFAPGGMGGMMFPGGMGGFNPGGAGSGTLTTVTETQLTSGLIEVTIYGTITLYEKYQPETPPAN